MLFILILFSLVFKARRVHEFYAVQDQIQTRFVRNKEAMVLERGERRELRRSEEKMMGRKGEEEVEEEEEEEEEEAASSVGTGSAATGSAATGSAATGSAATGSAATGSAATGSAATGSAATGATGGGTGTARDVEEVESISKGASSEESKKIAVKYFERSLSHLRATFRQATSFSVRGHTLQWISSEWRVNLEKMIKVVFHPGTKRWGSSSTRRGYATFDGICNTFDEAVALASDLDKMLRRIHKEESSEEANGEEATIVIDPLFEGESRDPDANGSFTLILSLSPVITSSEEERILQQVEQIHRTTKHPLEHIHSETLPSGRVDMYLENINSIELARDIQRKLLSSFSSISSTTSFVWSPVILHVRSRDQDQNNRGRPTTLEERVIVARITPTGAALTNEHEYDNGSPRFQSIDHGRGSNPSTNSVQTSENTLPRERDVGMVTIPSRVRAALIRVRC